MPAFAITLHYKIAQDWIGNLSPIQLANWIALERESHAAFCKIDHLKYVD